MVKLVDMLFLGSSVSVFWFEFEWWYLKKKIEKILLKI